MSLAPACHRLEEEPPQPMSSSSPLLTRPHQLQSPELASQKKSAPSGGLNRFKEFLVILNIFSDWDLHQFTTF